MSTEGNQSTSIPNMQVFGGTAPTHNTIHVDKYIGHKRGHGQQQSIQCSYIAVQHNTTIGKNSE